MAGDTSDRLLREAVHHSLRRGRQWPLAQFFDALPMREQAKLLRLFALLGDLGRMENPEKFGNLGKGLWEFKSFQIRMPCRLLPGGVVLVAHGFRRKRDRAPKKEIERARRILAEDLLRAEESAGGGAC